MPDTNYALYLYSRDMFTGNGNYVLPLNYPSRGDWQGTTLGLDSTKQPSILHLRDDDDTFSSAPDATGQSSWGAELHGRSLEVTQVMTLSSADGANYPLYIMNTAGANDKAGILISKDLADFWAAHPGEKLQIVDFTQHDTGSPLYDTIHQRDMRDGFVDGTSGDDVIGPGYGDQWNDKVDSADNTGAAGGTPRSDDDVIRGFEGDDTIRAGAGNDTVYGGDGRDRIEGGDGDDVLQGWGDSHCSVDDGAADTIDGGAGNDTIKGGGGDDLLFGQGGDDRIDGGNGNDTIWAGDGNDTVNAGAGDDVVKAGDGDDVVRGGAGNDTVVGGAGNDTIDGGAGDDVLEGDGVSAGGGNDVISGGAGCDTVFSGVGDDSVSGGAGSDLLFGDEGNDAVSGGAGDDRVFGGEGNDTVNGDAGNDTAHGDAGDDVIDGGDGDDALFGDSGADTVSGGAGNDHVAGDNRWWTGNGTDDREADVLTGGEGNDTFVGGTGDTITDFNLGNTGSINDGDQTNNDYVDLAPFYNWDTLAIINEERVAAGQSAFDDPLQWLRHDQQDGVLNDLHGQTTASGHVLPELILRIQNNGAAVDLLALTNDNTNVVCFSADALIGTASGPVAATDLRVGDLVRTRDAGMQPIRWIGRRMVRFGAGADAPMRPVLIPAGALGGGLPAADLRVSPMHGMILTLDPAQSLLGSDEVMVQARHLVGRLGIRIDASARAVEYVHFMFDDHQVVYANGAPSESFYSGPRSVAAAGQDAAEEIYELFPELRVEHEAGIRRPPVRPHAAAEIIARMLPTEADPRLAVATAAS